MWSKRTCVLMFLLCVTIHISTYIQYGYIKILWYDCQQDNDIDHRQNDVDVSILVYTEHGNVVVTM